MALGTSWTQIASRSFSVGGYNYTAYVYAKLHGSQDVAANKSYVDLELRINFSVWLASYNTDFYISGTGWIGYAYREWSAGTYTIASGQITVNHNDDGTGSFSATGGFEFGGMGVGATTFDSGSVSLPTIPRASVPSINTYPTSSPNFTLGDTITIHMNRKSSSFKHTVVFKYGSTAVTVGTAKAVENNVTFDTSTVMDAILALIPNASSYSGTIEVTTYNGNTQIGSTKSIPYKASVPSSYAPTVSGYTIAESATALSGKGVAASEVVRFLSKKTISVTVAAKSGASISKVVCSNGNKSVNMTLSSGKYTCTMEAPPSGTFTITATDSRGLQTVITQTGTFKEYEYPTIQASNLARANATANTGTLTANGTFWNGTAGSTTNAVTIQYKLNTASSYSTSTGTRSGNAWNINQAMTGLIYTNSYSCEIKATDSFGQTTTVTVNLPPSSAVMQLGDDTVQVNNYLLAKTDVGIGTGGAVTTKLSEVAALADQLNSDLHSVIISGNTATFGNGLIIQWGGQTIANNTPTTITYPKEFPNQC
ncbi:MAG: hypothetical protein IJH14_06455, partial [Solobacterium sp.]|nr:hypothetical protein [Solobacterium sp.]